MKSCRAAVSRETLTHWFTYFDALMDEPCRTMGKGAVGDALGHRPGSHNSQRYRLTTPGQRGLESIEATFRTRGFASSEPGEG